MPAARASRDGSFLESMQETTVIWPRILPREVSVPLTLKYKISQTPKELALVSETFLVILPANPYIGIRRDSGDSLYIFDI